MKYVTVIACLVAVAQQKIWKILCALINKAEEKKERGWIEVIYDILSGKTEESIAQVLDHRGYFFSQQCAQNGWNWKRPFRMESWKQQKLYANNNNNHIVHNKLNLYIFLARKEMSLHNLLSHATIA